MHLNQLHDSGSVILREKGKTKYGVPNKNCLLSECVRINPKLFPNLDVTHNINVSVYTTVIAVNFSLVASEITHTRCLI